jgi:hypothetical protein
MDRAAPPDGREKLRLVRMAGELNVGTFASHK